MIWSFILVMTWASNTLLITIISIFFTAQLSIAGSTDILKYHVDLSLLGQIGHSEIIVDIKDNEYQIQMNATLDGIYSILSSNKKVNYISKGKIIEGKFVSDRFEKKTETVDKKTHEIFLFDHVQKKITVVKEETKKVENSFPDIDSFSSEEKIEYIHSKENKVLDRYAYYDTLSFLLNMSHLSQGVVETQVHPIGATKENQSITLEDYTQKDKIKALFDKDKFNKILLMRVKKEDEEYELLLGLDTNGILQEAVTTKTIFPLGTGRIQRSAYTTLNKVDHVNLQ